MLSDIVLSISKGFEESLAERRVGDWGADHMDGLAGNLEVDIWISGLHTCSGRE